MSTLRVTARRTIWTRLATAGAALVVIVGASLLFAVMWYLHTTNVRGYAEGVAVLVFGTITLALWGQRRDLGEGDPAVKVTDARGAGVRRHAVLGFRRSR